MFGATIGMTQESVLSWVITTPAFLSWSLLCFRPLPPSLSPPARNGGDKELRAEEEEAAIAGNTAPADAALVASADGIPG